MADNATGAADYGWLGSHQRLFEHHGNLATVEMGARPYVPALGRFLQTDPIEGGSANDYDYVNGDPINAFDLAGTCNSAAAWCIIGILIGLEKLPNGFLSWGNRRCKCTYTVVGNATRRWSAQGGCSHSPDLAFGRSCKTHDLGYDLLRFFRVGGGIRRSIDQLFKNDLYRVCSGYRSLAGSFCRRAADGYAYAVNKNTTNQHAGVP